MTDGVKVDVAKSPKPPEIEDKKNRIVKVLGLDVDGTAALYSPKLDRMTFDPAIKDFYEKTAPDWDYAAFITARKISTSIRDFLRYFYADHHTSITPLLSSSIDGISSDLPEGVDLTYLSPFDEAGHVSFVQDVLIPAEAWIFKIAQAAMASGERDFASLENFIKLIVSLYSGKTPFTAEQLLWLKQTLADELNITDGNSLEFHWANYYCTVAAYGFDDYLDQVSETKLPGHVSDYAETLELCYLELYYSAHPKFENYAQRYFTTIYPEFRTYGKTKSLLSFAQRELALTPDADVHLALIDDSPSFIKRSQKGLDALQKSLEGTLVLNTHLWKAQSIEAKIGEELAKLLGPKALIESPRSVTVCLDVLACRPVKEVSTVSEPA